jgi:hypothetical protein
MNHTQRPIVDFESIPWGLAEGKYQGNWLLIRFREFSSDFAKCDYPTRLNIFWTMSEPDENGLASDSEAATLETFESRLVDAVESDRHSILSVVLTCSGKREFVFHTPDDSEFMARLTNMTQELARYPVEIHSHPDRTWAYDDSVIPDH